MPCRSNGSITIDVFYGPKASAPILIYLPSGPLSPDDGAEEHAVAALSAATKATIARVNYRCPPEKTWPTPIHDVMNGHDWIIDNMLAEQALTARLGVCGELFGGSLATSLALTECRIGESRIVAAAVNNPIADWVFPDELPVAYPAALPEPSAPDETYFPADQDHMSAYSEDAQKQAKATLTKAGKPRKRAKRAPKKTAWLRNSDNPLIPTRDLMSTRNALFSKPSLVFDRFVSPIHFFRSPHGEYIIPVKDQSSISSSPSDIPLDQHDFETLMVISHYESYVKYEDSETEPPVLTRCRAYARNYPPATSLLRLPEWHLTSGTTSPLLDQATELTKMIKRSIAKQHLLKTASKASRTDPATKKQCEAWAEERVTLLERSGTGLWTRSDGPDTQHQLQDVGHWLQRRLHDGLR